MNATDLVYPGVAITLSDLTLAQVALLNLKVALGGDPRDLPFYANVAHLFTTTDSGVPVMHDVTQECVSIWINRNFPK